MNTFEITVCVTLIMLSYVFCWSLKKPSSRKSISSLRQDILKRDIRDMGWDLWDKKKKCGAVVFHGEKYIKEEDRDIIRVTDMEGKFLREFKIDPNEEVVTMAIIKNEALVYQVDGWISVYELSGNFMRRFKDEDKKENKRNQT